MSVTTKADELLDSARFDLELAQLLVAQAQAKVDQALAPGTWGHDEFNAEFEVSIWHGLAKLAKFRKHVARFGARRFSGVPRGWDLPNGFEQKLKEVDVG